MTAVAAVLSQPGCILASPSFPNSTTHLNQDYVYNWTRDSAIVAVELAAGPLPTSQPLIDYVQFAQTCQNSASGIGHFERASFLINGTARDTSDQADGRPCRRWRSCGCTPSSTRPPRRWRAP